MTDIASVKIDGPKPGIKNAFRGKAGIHRVDHGN